MVRFEYMYAIKIINVKKLKTTFEVWLFIKKIVFHYKLNKNSKNIISHINILNLNKILKVIYIF